LSDSPTRPPVDPSEIDPDRAVGLGGRRNDPSTLAAIGVGGFLGAVVRYQLGLWWPAGTGFPWTTFAINVSGSFALGLLVTLMLERWRPHPLLRPLIAIGFLGAYTTFSTFAVDADLLIDRGKAGTAALNIFLSLVVAIVGIVGGITTARRLRRPAR
jgi:fluoride exporter